MEVISYILLALSVVVVVLLILVLTTKNNQNDFSALRMELTNQLKHMSDLLSDTQNRPPISRIVESEI